MRAAVFIRYHSGDELGHLGWAFDIAAGQVNAGSVENHSGHLLSPSQDDGFWSAIAGDPVPAMCERGYDDVKYVETADANPVQAARVVKWIQSQAYRAAFRNCEDDVYDVLRAYGVKSLPAPALHWLPKRWFKSFEATKTALKQFEWGDTGRNASSAVVFETLSPLRPSWRHPLRLEFHTLQAARLFETLRGKFMK